MQKKLYSSHNQKGRRRTGKRKRLPEKENGRKGIKVNHRLPREGSWAAERKKGDAATERSLSALINASFYKREGTQVRKKREGTTGKNDDNRRKAVTGGTRTKRKERGRPDRRKGRSEVRSKSSAI